MDDKHLALQADLDADTEYQALRQAYFSALVEFRQIIRELKPAQQEIIHQYLGTLAEMQMREIELALMQI